MDFVRYGIDSVVAPPKLIVIAPPKLHIHIELSLSAGLPPTRTVGDPGAHGAAVAGTQGPGVNTPSAAAVNDAVAGLARLLQTPKGAMFMNGLLSMMFAAGLFSIMTGGPVGITVKLLGATPNEQLNNAPVTTGRPIAEG
jgi:hypothetical protein